MLLSWLMAKNTVVRLVDDLDGRPADETVSFALDGTGFEIDLSAKHAKKLRTSLGRFVAAARRSAPPVRRPGPVPFAQLNRPPRRSGLGLGTTTCR